MSFDYAFGVGNPAIDEYLSKPYPAVIFNGTETPLGAYFEQREVNGVLWTVYNAQFNAGLGGWQQVNPALTSFAAAQSATGVTYYTAAVGVVSPFTWTVAPLVLGSALQATENGTAAYVPPVYNASGASLAATTHIVKGQVTAAATTTTVALLGAAVFTDTSYFFAVFDTTAGALVSLSAQTVSSISFVSVVGHIYSYLLVGA